MDASIEQLEQQLNHREKICSSPDCLSSFPPTLCRPFRTPGIGFIVCQNGHFAFSIGGKRYQAHTGETVFLPNDETFRILKYSPNLEAYLMIYEVEPIRDNLGTTVTSMNIYSKIYPHKYHVYHTGEEDELIQYITLINRTHKEHSNSFNTYEQKLLLISLTYHLCSIFQRKMLQSNSLNARRTEVFLHLIQLIDTNYMQQRGVEFYADKLCLTPKYLSGLSKAVCGYTVQELVFKAIIRKSKTLLSITNKTIQEISNDFHFPNASSFGTFFKKQTGMSPQKYRDTENEGEPT